MPGRQSVVAGGGEGGVGVGEVGGGVGGGGWLLLLLLLEVGCDGAPAVPPGYDVESGDADFEGRDRFLFPCGCVSWCSVVGLVVGGAEGRGVTVEI
jgi:hypothetical protein